MYCNQCSSYSCGHLIQGIGTIGGVGQMASAQQQHNAILNELMMKHYMGNIPRGLANELEKPKTRKKLLLLRK